MLVGRRRSLASSATVVADRPGVKPAHAADAATTRRRARRRTGRTTTTRASDARSLAISRIGAAATTRRQLASAVAGRGDDVAAGDRASRSERVRLRAASAGPSARPATRSRTAVAPTSPRLVQPAAAVWHRRHPRPRRRRFDRQRAASPRRRRCARAAVAATSRPTRRRGSTTCTSRTAVPVAHDTPSGGAAAGRPAPPRPARSGRTPPRRRASARHRGPRDTTIRPRPVAALARSRASRPSGRRPTPPAPRRRRRRRS